MFTHARRDSGKNETRKSRATERKLRLETEDGSARPGDFAERRGVGVV